MLLLHILVHSCACCVLKSFPICFWPDFHFQSPLCWTTSVGPGEGTTSWKLRLLHALKGICPCCFHSTCFTKQICPARYINTNRKPEWKIQIMHPFDTKGSYLLGSLDWDASTDAPCNTMWNSLLYFQGETGEVKKLQASKINTHGGMELEAFTAPLIVFLFPRYIAPWHWTNYYFYLPTSI